MHVLFAEGLHDEAWLRQHSVGWEELRERVTEYPPQRVAAITGIPAEQIVALGAPLWHDQTGPAEVRRRHPAARQRRPDVSARSPRLPAVVGQYGVRGGGLYYSTCGYVSWDGEARQPRSRVPAASRVAST